LRDVLTRYGLEQVEGAVPHDRIGVPEQGQSKRNRLGVGILAQNLHSQSNAEAQE
jgi:hypothetical protein